MTSPPRNARWGNCGLGCRPPNAALTDDEVRSIRERLADGTATRAAIVAEFGLSKATVQAIATRRSYTHVR